MVLLAGLVVNAGIYQIYEYRSLLRKESVDIRQMPTDKVNAYLEAFRLKAVPVFLTVLSTILGLLPFLFEAKGEYDFWHSLAVGSMGGLFFSILAYVFVLPIFINLRPRKHQALIKSNSGQNVSSSGRRE